MVMEVLRHVGRLDGDWCHGGKGEMCGRNINRQSRNCDGDVSQMEKHSVDV